MSYSKSLQDWSKWFSRFHFLKTNPNNILPLEQITSIFRKSPKFLSWFDQWQWHTCLAVSANVALPSMEVISTEGSDGSQNKPRRQKKRLRHRCTEEDDQNTEEADYTLHRHWQSHSSNVWAFPSFTMEHFKPSHCHRWRTTQTALAEKCRACCYPKTLRMALNSWSGLLMY